MIKRGRANKSRLWTYFTRLDNGKAICSQCQASLSFKSTTFNLKSHLRRRHYRTYVEYMNGENGEVDDREDHDEDSNSSLKFSSEIWGQFEQDGALARCTLCQKTTENTVEDMKSHLEEEHPGIMISILNPPDDDKSQDDDTFTEVVYLEEEEKRKAPKRRKPVPDGKVQLRVPGTRSDSIPESRPDIDSFLNYVGVLLRNVEKEAMPKLQLDVISLVLKAQMAANSKETNENNVENKVTIPSTILM